MRVHNEGYSSDAIHETTVAVHLQRTTKLKSIKDSLLIQLAHVLPGRQHPVADAIWWAVVFARPPVDRIRELRFRFEEGGEQDL